MKQSVIKGFTLVELLIVVIILAILAAIIVPQFVSSTDDAKIASLDSTLAKIRSSLTRYSLQHNGRYPGLYSTIDGITAVNNPFNRVVTFNDQLMLYTDINGKSSTIKVSPFIYGPYLKKRIPKNPVTTDPNLVIINSGELGMSGDFARGGWKFDGLTGQFIANDTSLDPNNIRFDNH